MSRLCPAGRDMKKEQVPPSSAQPIVVHAGGYPPKKHCRGSLPEVRETRMRI
jgi:hypothetical protein